MNNTQTIFGQTTDLPSIVSLDKNPDTSGVQEKGNFTVGVTKPYRVVEKQNVQFVSGDQLNKEMNEPIDTEVQEAISKYNYSMFS